MAKGRPPQTRKKLGGPRIGDGGPRQAKAEAVAELQDRFGSSTAVLVSEYRGMTVAELAELRGTLREAGAEHKIFKNTLATIAARAAGHEDLVSYLEGPTAFTFSGDDAVLAAKRLNEFAKKVPTLVIKGGLFEGKAVSAAEVQAIANLESREVLLTKIAGLFQTPIQQLANLLAAPLNQLGSVLAQLRDKLPADAAPPAAAEAAPAEAAPGASEPAADESPAAEPTAEAAGEPAAEAAAEPAEAPVAEAPEAPEAAVADDTTDQTTEG